LNKYDLPDRALGDLSGQANVQKSTNHENMEFRLYPMLLFCESVGESTRKHPPDQSRLAGCLEMSNKHKYINTANVVSVGSPASAWANQIDGIDEAGASLPLPPPPPPPQKQTENLLPRLSHPSQIQTTDHPPTIKHTYI